MVSIITLICLDNSAAVGGVIIATGVSNIYIENCLFERNSAMRAGVMQVFEYSSLKDINSVYQYNFAL